MTDYNTYIFDLDGTLLNTLTDLAIATNHALRMYGMPERTTDEVRMFVGNGVRKLIERAVPAGTDNPDIENVYNTFREYYMSHSMNNTEPYPGVIEMLAELKRRNKKIAVVSNKFYMATQQLCRYFFDGYISVAIGEKETIRKKPFPDTVFAALEQLGADKNGAVYIGDSDVDIETARNSGLPCISVLWGFRDKDFLLSKGASVCISTPGELL